MYQHTRQTISKTYLINELKNINDVNDSFMFRLDNDKYHTFIIKLGQDYVYYIEVYKVHSHVKPYIQHSAFTKKEVIKKLGLAVPKYMKLHNNF